jgi:L-ascorbate metabolism protein UlaG (beta-lactamase superfamily)
MFKFTWFGHATLGLEVAGQHILIDPFFTGNPLASTDAAHVAADYILVSHGHGDHLGDTVEIALRTGATIISVAEIVNWLGRKNKTLKLHGQHLGGGFTYPFGYLKLTQALHGSGLPDGSYGGNPAGFLLTTPQSQKIYIAGDTGLFGDMKLIGEEGIDLAVLPVGDNYTMGPADALRAVKMLTPRYVIPIHYNTFELINQDVPAWARKVEAETTSKVVLLSPGQDFSL